MANNILVQNILIYLPIKKEIDIETFKDINNKKPNELSEVIWSIINKALIW